MAFLIVPGPAVLYIVTRSVDQGRAAGLASVAGVEVGSMIHVVVAAFGLSALLMTSALAFGAVKYLGAAYLVYLGVRKLFERGDARVSAAVVRQPLRRIFIDGVVVNLLNPKTALFFLAFLPQFVDPANGSVATQILVLGAVLVTLAFLSDGSYALLAARIGGWLRARPWVQRAQGRFTGGVYIALGATAALSGARASSK
jgi:threonine/homoserine/homoserine lactone efflux protein